MSTTNLFNSNLAEIEIKYKSKVKPSERQKITSSKDLFEIAQQMFNADTLEYNEEFIIVLLNRANKVLGWMKVGSGGITGTVADTRMIFSVALKAAATSLILMHNHPSGNLTPSPEDRSMTDKCKEAGKLLDIKVLDHIIVTSEGYFSFADEGLV